jgi:hypothetical protein
MSAAATTNVALLTTRLVATANNGLGCLDRKAARERTKPTEHSLLVRRQQLIAPRDRRIHRLLAFGKVAQTEAREQQVLSKPAEQIVGAQHFHPRSRELEGERQRIEPSTNRGHRRTVSPCEVKFRLHVPDAFHEQLHGRGFAAHIRGRHCILVYIQREGVDDVLPFSSYTKRGPTGGQHSKRRNRGEEIGDHRRGIEHLLEVVKHQHHRLIGACEPGSPRQVERGGVREAEPLGNRRRDERRAPDAGQWHEHDPVCVFCRNATSQLQRQTRLPNASWPDERNESCGPIAKPLPERLNIKFAAKKLRRGQRQWNAA